MKQIQHFAVRLINIAAPKCPRMNLGPKYIEWMFSLDISPLVMTRSCSHQPPRRLNRPLSPVSIKTASAFRDWRGSFSKIFFKPSQQVFPQESDSSVWVLNVTFACFCWGLLTLVRLNACTVYQTRHSVLCAHVALSANYNTDPDTWQGLH